MMIHLGKIWIEKREALGVFCSKCVFNSKFAYLFTNPACKPDPVINHSYLESLSFAQLRKYVAHRCAKFVQWHGAIPALN